MRRPRLRPGSLRATSPGRIPALAALALLTLAGGCVATGPAPAEPTAAPAAGRRAVGFAADALAAAFADADTLRVDSLAPGLTHAYAWLPEGPWAVHVLAVDLHACELAVEARHGGPPLERAAPTSEILEDALAGVNADFFALPAGTPINALVHEHEVLASRGPRAWPVLGIRGRDVVIGEPELAGHVDWWRPQGAGPDGGVVIVAVNREPAPEDAAGAALFTEWFGPTAPADPARAAVQVAAAPRGVPLRDPTRGVAGRRGVALRVDTAGAALRLGRDTVVFLLPLGTRPPAQGDSLRWPVAVSVDEVPAASRVPFVPAEVVGGYPVLLRGGAEPAALRTEPREAFGLRRHPRTAVGVGADGRTLLLVTVDGRQAPYSDGMTLPETAALLRRLGADVALNLDGGGSTTMVVHGDVVNRVSDAEGERPVGSVIAVVRQAIEANQANQVPCPPD